MRHSITSLAAASGAANSVLGVNGAARRWAQKLGVDPYTTNPILHKARLIAALYAVKADGVTDYVDAASDAGDEREALFFVESAQLLAGLHKGSPVNKVLKDSRALVARTGTKAVVLLPFDAVRWTESLEKQAREIADRSRQELGAAALEIHISGSATAAARAGLKSMGWTVVEGAATGIGAAPAD